MSHENQVREAHTSWQRAWADRSQASAQSGAGLKVSRGPEDAAAPQQRTASCRAPSPALGAGRSRTTTRGSSPIAAKRDPAVPEELGQAKARRWVLYEEGNSLPSPLPSSPKLAQSPGVRKTPLNQRSTMRQDTVEVPLSDPGLYLQHHHPAALAKRWPDVPQEGQSSPESTPEPQGHRAPAHSPRSLFP